MIRIIYRIIRNYFNKLFKFRYMDLNEESKYLIFDETSTYNIDLSKIDNRWRDSYSFVNRWSNETYLMHYNHECYIEPLFGYAINSNKEYMLHTNAGSYREIKYGSKYGKAIPPDRFIFTLKKRLATKIDKAIILTGFFGKNYFFAYDQALGQLWLLKQYGIDLSLPVIISKTLFETVFFQEIISITPFLKNINWITRNDEHYNFKNAHYFRCKEIYAAKTKSYTNTHLIPVTNMFSTIQSELSSIKDKKVFLTRSAKRGRHLSNSEEIEKIAQSFGFEIIDTDGLTVKEQILLFRNVSYLIALHGAGNANMIFRYPNKLKFLEIHTPDWVGAGYLIVASELGYEYDVYWGTKLVNKDSYTNSSFRLDPDGFKQKISEWLKE